MKRKNLSKKQRVKKRLLKERSNQTAIVPYTGAPPPQADPNPKGKGKGSKGGAQGGAKGGAKGSGKAPADEWAKIMKIVGHGISRNGKKVCPFYNSSAGCRFGDSCKDLHECLLCHGQKHKWILRHG